ncbi:GMC oxidoreductase [Kitasatospora sp. NPDC059673]|uniref:GMC oxidoreductase n=1 Tax=Kitasatospora sp. NPDC059673 TaxID=3346901 RepID=UPI00369256DF
MVAPHSHADPAQGLEELLLASFEEAAAGDFDVIIVGGGATAAVTLKKLLQLAPGTRVLLLEQGPYLLPDHVQNLGSVLQPLMDRAVAKPWRSEGDLELIFQVPYLGGRTLFWSGASPQPTAQQLAGWPKAVVDELDGEWAEAKEIVGVRRASELGREFGNLNSQLRQRIHQGTGPDSDLALPEDPGLLDAPLGMAATTAPGATRKFSAVPVLLAAAAGHRGSVAILPKCKAVGLTCEDGRVTAVRTTRGELPVGGARIVLATGTVENTELVLRSLPASSTRLAGANLAGNAASFFNCRVPRAAFEDLATDRPELAALYLDGATDDRAFVLHLSASATVDPGRDVETVYRLLPDVFGEGTPERLTDPDHVVFLVNGVTELGGVRAADSPSRVFLDQDGATVGAFHLDESDRRAWDALDRTTDEVLRLVARGSAMEFWSPERGQWESEPPAAGRRMPFAFLESGTLWMGESPEDSVTDLHGRLHVLDNLYVTGGALFPTRGSWNPLLTMAALALRLARHLAR